MMADEERPPEEAAPDEAASEEATPDEAAPVDAAPEDAPRGAPTPERAPAEETNVEQSPPEDAPTGETAAQEAPAPPAADAEPSEAPGDAAAEPPQPEQPAGEPAAAPAKPEIPGADLEVDIVPEGSDPLLAEDAQDELIAEAAPDVAADGAAAGTVEEPAPAAAPAPAPAPAPRATIDLAADARYSATGKRKTAVARVILKPGGGSYRVNGKDLGEHFPRATLQRNIRQPLETVGYESRMDVVATLHGGGIAAQAGALRHGIARALIDADPNLRRELKRRGFLTRDPRVKERRKAGLKKARKRPQFSKR